MPTSLVGNLRLRLTCNYSRNPAILLGFSCVDGTRGGGVGVGNGSVKMNKNSWDSYLFWVHMVPTLYYLDDFFSRPFPEIGDW